MKKSIIISFIILSIVGCKDAKEQYLASEKKYDQKTFVPILKTTKYEKIRKIKIKKDSVIRIKFDLKNNINHAIPFASYVKDYKIIKLETNDTNLIANISSLIFCNDNIICVDAFHTKTINIFDTLGNYKHTISALGKGPGEYVDLTDVTFDKNKSLIKIYDFIQNRILSYNLQGQFIQMEKARFRFRDFRYINNNSFVYNNDNGLNSHLNQASLNQLLIEDNTNTLYYGLPFHEEKVAMNFFNPTSFSSNTDGYLFFPMLSDTLYEITSLGTKIKYIIKCNPQIINYNEKHNIEFYKNFLIERNKKQYVYIINAIETDDLLLLLFRYGTKNMWGIYNKNTAKINVGIGLAMNLNKMPVWCNPRITYNNYFVGYSDAISVVKEIEQLKSKPDSIKRKHKDLLKTLKNISENDNPVIIMYKITNIE